MKVRHALSFRYAILIASVAHEVRNRSTKQFQAVEKLTAQHRWCLTGTPIQNTLEDLGALISFLKVPILDKPQAFRTYIIAPTFSRSRTRYQNLQKLLQSICLRRTKDIVGLPETVPEQRLLRLSDGERREYDGLFRRFKEFVQMAVSGRRSKVSATVLHSIHELRLFCNNGPRRATREALDSDDELLSILQQHDASVCARCGGPIYSIDQNSGDANVGIFIAACKHLVCHSCLPHCYASKHKCMLCAEGHVPMRPSEESCLPLSRGDRYEDLSEQPTEEEFPSKLIALLGDLQKDQGNKW